MVNNYPIQNRGRFNEFNEYTKIISDKIMKSDNLCKLLLYDIKDALNKSITSRQKSQLFMDRIYPHPFIPDINTDSKTVLCFYFDEVSLGRRNSSFKSANIVFNIFSHEKLWILDDMNVRVWSMLHEIDLLFNGFRDLGIGELRLTDDRSGARYIPPFSYDSKFHGYQVKYKNYEFDR